MLYRKVDPPVWNRAVDFGELEVPATTLLTELRAKGNELSFWRTASREHAIMAIAGGFKNLSGFAISWIEESDLLSDGIRLIESPGDTCIEEFRTQHRDAVTLDATRLARIASHLARAIRQQDRLFLVTEDEAVDSMKAAVDAGLIGASHLPRLYRERVRL